jgi:hypothetical protein
MKKNCIFSIFAFFAVSIGMHAQEIGDTDEPYSGYTINLSSPGALKSFLSYASSDFILTK